MNRLFKNTKVIKTLVITLEFLALAAILYLIALPFYPALRYELYKKENRGVDFKDIDEAKKAVEEVLNSLPASEEVVLDKDSGVDSKKNENVTPQNNAATSSVSLLKIQETKINRLIIPKIGVNIPIIENENENYGLARGAWKVPESSVPDKGSNTVITAHRFKYLPPSNLTFYLIDKLEAGDIASILWNGKIYYYRVREKKIIAAADTSILRETDSPTLTMYTCDPIYSTKNRLVIVSELINKN